MDRFWDVLGLLGIIKNVNFLGQERMVGLVKQLYFIHFKQVSVQF